MAGDGCDWETLVQSGKQALQYAILHSREVAEVIAFKLDAK
jgi:hypothetical protein